MTSHLKISFQAFCLSIFGFAIGQVPVSDFVAPATACLSETILLNNQSQNAATYVWDFCHEDLKSTPAPNTIVTLPPNITGDPHVYHSIKVIQDAGQWYGFITDLNGRKIFRLDFGNSLDNTPDYTDLGSFTGLTSPGPIEMIRVAGVWYALVGNVSSTTIIRLQFGGGLQAAPTLTENLGNFGNKVNRPAGIEVVEFNSTFYCYVANFNTDNILVIDYGSSILNTPVSTQLLAQSSILANPFGFSTYQDGGNLYAMTADFTGSSVFLLSFGANPLNEPAITQINGIPLACEIELTKEGDEFIALARARLDGIYRIELGPNLTSPTPVVTDLNISTSQSRSVTLVRDAPLWRTFAVDVTTGNFRRIDFAGDCSTTVSSNSSVAENPNNIFYKQPGDYVIELTASATNLQHVTRKTIAVQDLTASGVQIETNENECVSSATSFSVTSSASLMDYNWDFGDGTPPSNVQTPDYQYMGSGSYIVTLRATEQNGCQNIATKMISIYDAPVADFALPTVSGTVCTLQPYPFLNQTSVDVNATVTWAWKINNLAMSSTANLINAFPSANTYSIELTASIPGCASSVLKDFIVTGEGNTVDFDFEGQCLGEITHFTNNTTGTISSYSWNFDDGQQANQTSPDHVFQSIGSYDVTLEATNASGCINAQTQTVLITSAPVPDFYIDLPPFSCSGTPTQFHDATPAPTDGNIVSWSWDFSDGSSTSSQQHPQHTYTLPGSYLVTLQVETNFGCQSTIQIPVDIAESLQADFLVGPACLQKGTQFQSLAIENVLSWNWSINNSFYSFPDPTHTFSLPGTYQATLMVVGANGCEAFVTKNITIHPAPLLDYTTSAPCTDAETIFTDMSQGVDMPVDWMWVSNGLESAMGSPASIIFTSSGVSPVEMLVTTAAGCEYSLIKNVVVAPSPIASFTASSTFGAPPMQVQFNNTSLNASSYAWNFGFNNNTATSTNPTFTYTELGDFLVELTASNGAGCTDSHSQTINVLVPIYNLTLENLVISENFSSPSKTPVVTIKNNSNVWVAGTNIWVTGRNGLRLKSNVDLNLVPGATAEVELPIEIFSAEDYLCVELDFLGDVNVSDNSSCQNLTDKPVLMTPYPNPTSGTLWFDVVLSEPVTGTLKIADSMGKTVFNQQFPDLSMGMNRIQIDFENQSPGAYLAIWEVNGKTSTFRFLAQ